MINNSDDLCDEEKSFNSWFADHGAALSMQINGDSPMNLFKVAYMKGYAAGFQAKLEYKSKEYLQK